MSFCGTPFVNSLPSQEAVFRAELNALPSLHERAQRIDQKLHQARTSLGSRDEKLLGLRSDFDALTLAFWREFGRGLGCTDPAATIAHEQARLRSVGFIGTILCVLVVTIWVVAVLQNGGDTGVAVCVLVFALCGIGFLITLPLHLMAHARSVSAVLGREQSPFWLTSGSIALSNLSMVKFD